MFKVVEHFAVRAETREEAIQKVAKFTVDLIFRKTQELHVAMNREPEVQTIYFDVEEVRCEST